MKKRTRYAKAKPIKKKKKKIAKRDIVITLLIWAIGVIILIILCLIIGRKYL